MTRAPVKVSLAMSQQLDNLGFDRVQSALVAVLTHPDWVTRWDCDHQELIKPVLIVQQWRDEVMN